jgi:phage-related protein
MDLAASKGIPLEQATKLVAKADDESYAALSKLGIEIDKNADRETALAAIHTATAGAADIFANSTEGAAIRAQASMDNALESIGGAVAPGIQAALGGVAEFLSSDTFSGAVEFVSSILTEGLGAAFSFVQGLIQPLIDAVSPLFAAFQNLGTGASGTTTLMDGFKTILNTVQSFILTNVIPVVGQIATFLAENLPGAIQFAKDAWNNVLQPALSNIWQFITNNVLPILGDVAAFLRDNLPGAIQAAADFWNTVLQPALSNLWTFIQNNVIPIFIQVRDWLAVTLPPAIQTLADFWNNILQPALSNAWAFIQDNVIPILSVLITEGLNAVGTAVSGLADFWNNTLGPALSTVADFIGNTLVPGLRGLVTEGIDRVLSAARTFADFWNNNLKPAIDGVGNAIGKVIDFINDLINKLGNIDLPDFMTPGSPTPWEMGLRGVAGAMSQVSGQELPALAREMDALNPPALMDVAGRKPLGDASSRPSLVTGAGEARGQLTIILQDERTILRPDRQSERLALRTRLETREAAI